jgi:hypothetical protein
MRLAQIALILAIAAALSTAQAGAKAHKKKPPKLPACSHLPSSKMAKLFDVSSLKLEGVTPHSDICTWTGKRSGHYHVELQIGFAPGSRSLFDTVKKAAQKSAKRQGARFATVHKSSPAIIEVSKIDRDKHLKRCDPGHKIPQFGPPQCESDPPWYTDSADTYGTMKRGGAHVIVSTNVGIELGDSGLHVMVDLAKDILSGKI